MDIQVNRIKPFVGGNALSWSEDGDLAIVAVPNVVVYSAKDYTEGKKLEFVRAEVIDPDNFPYNKETDPHSSLNQIDFAPPIASKAEWSPTGITKSGGCFLTILTNKHQLLIFENIGAVGSSEWGFVVDLCFDIPDNEAIKCFDWHRVNDGTVWGHALLALGTDSGLFILKVSNGDFEFVATHDVKTCRTVKYAGDQLYAQTPDSIVQISADGSTETYKLTTGTVGSIHVDTQGILVAQPGRVTHYPSGTVTLVGFFEDTIGFLGDCNKWSAVSSKGNVYTHNNFESNIQQYLLNKRNTAQLTVLGLSTSPDGSSFAMSYSSRPSDGLFFPSLKYKAIVLSLQSLHRPDYSDFRVAPRSHWISAYLSHAPLPQFGEIEVPSDLESFEALMVDTNIGKMRLETYFNATDYTTTIRKLIGTILLKQIGKNQDDLSPTDRAILVSYTKYEPAEIQCPNELEISSKDLTETFDFLGQRQHNVIESNSKHVWRRCDITLLPIFSMDTSSSTNNQFQILAEDAGELGDSKLGQQLVSLPFCLYNGCRFYRKVKLEGF